MNFFKAFVIKYLYLLFGFFLAGFGISLIVNTPLGFDSWTVFHVGITLHTPLTLGQVSQLVGAFLILIGWSLKIKPGIGTFANMFFIGFFIDLISSFEIINYANSTAISLIYVISGTAIFAIGCGIYINCDLGAGPRDSIMLGLSNVTGKSIAFVRTVLELSVLVVGFFLGGTVGVGTIIFALTVGHFVQWSLKVLTLPKFVVNAEKIYKDKKAINYVKG